MKQKTKEVMHELKHHIPFTIIATLIAVILFFLMYSSNKQIISQTIFLFYGIHELHLFASAMVTSAMFYKYQKNFLKALIIGLTGSLIIGSLSDVLMPYLGGQIFGLKTILHFPLLEEPAITLSALFFGSIVGITTKLTKFPHTIHVFVSVLASLFYLTAFSQTLSLIHFMLISTIIFLTVIIPCCVSDIIYPFLFLNQKIKNCCC